MAKSTKTYEMTGSPKEFGFKTKEDFVAMMKSKGYTNTGLNEECTLLVTDDLNSKSSKMAKAKKLGIKIVTYSDMAKKTKVIEKAPKSKKLSTAGGKNIVTDIDGNVYKTVIIGTQEWTAENLNVEHYRNGDPIPQVQDMKKWSKLETGAWCYYDNDPSKGNKYGKLYNWYAVNDSRGLAPEGWHVPSDAEWTALTIFLGGEEVAGAKLKATTLWYSPNTGATNKSGFTGLPGGYRIHGGDYCLIGLLGYFWSASENGNYLAWFRSLGSGNSAVSFYFSKKSGFSIRCVKD